MSRIEIFREIGLERCKQDEKWGEQNHNPYKWIAILIEEVGEAGQAVLQEKPDSYRKELVQVAAVTIAMIECFDRQEELNGDSDQLAKCQR